MISRRVIFTTSIAATAVSFFTLGALHERRNDAQAQRGYESQLQQLRTEMRAEFGKKPGGDATAVPAGTAGRVEHAQAAPASDGMAARAKMVAEIKQELQSEMGLLPLNLLRDRRSSF